MASHCSGGKCTTGKYRNDKCCMVGVGKLWLMGCVQPVSASYVTCDGFLNLYNKQPMNGSLCFANILHSLLPLVTVGVALVVYLDSSTVSYI